MKKRGGIRTVNCGSSQPKPSSYSVSSASSEHNCRTSNGLLCMGGKKGGNFHYVKEFRKGLQRENVSVDLNF